MKHTTGIAGAYRMDATALSNAAGVNLGNLVFRHALRFIISDLDAFEPVTGPEYRDIVQSEKPDHVLVSCANWLGQTQRDEQFNLGRAEMVEAADCTVTAFGLGVQAPAMDAERPIRLGPNSIRLARALSERAPQLSVRDELTRRTLEASGITNAVVTGCPSNFINCDPDLGRRVAARAAHLAGRLTRWDEVRSAISEVTGGHVASGAVLKRQMAMLDETPAFYILQTPGLLPFVLGERTNITDLYRENNPFMGQSGRLSKALLSKVLHFGNVEAWLDFSRTCDLSFGMRIHGTMVPLQAGVPSVLVAHDSRTVGLAAAMGVPWISPEQFLTIHDAGPQAMLDAFAGQIEGYDAKRKVLAGVMKNLVEASGLRPHAELLRLV
ncbi:MAG: polysaccharide pyruvyl transferase family protein [Rhodobacterales bacterium]|nr:polysaccharide pyruvyl transferase family protein [Rhodobacterales bacterium]NCT11688.1 polysaccharide pyruvyl transferase family protein [Rhodobacterales bacterium]